MSINSCDNCGTEIDTSINLFDNEYECPKCRKKIYIPADNNWEHSIIDYADNIIEKNKRKNSVIVYPLILIAIIGVIFCWVGGLLIHIWTVYLAYENLSVFWAIAALCTPILSTVFCCYCLFLVGAMVLFFIANNIYVKHIFFFHI